MRCARKEMFETFRIEPLGEEHDRAGFESGSAALDRYFKTQASQDLRRRISTCFIAVNRDSGEIAAYYTLAATSIALTDLSPAIVKKLPRYPWFPPPCWEDSPSRFPIRGRGSAAFCSWTH